MQCCVAQCIECMRRVAYQQSDGCMPSAKDMLSNPHLCFRGRMYPAPASSFLLPPAMSTSLTRLQNFQRQNTTHTLIGACGNGVTASAPHLRAVASAAAAAKPTCAARLPASYVYTVNQLRMKLLPRMIARESPPGMIAEMHCALASPSADETCGRAALPSEHLSLPYVAAG